ncbi:hypothetical protein RFI_08657 [Reticulomyxa filosa]|uniref:Uncharacterized protein n=1 Tax=Reticulomyxa filosa TaxID=46433 RepID=X6NQB2_RETFI|nr:hypothetical protein RFI_08657 [Reticulomyxa filosa]|eukprot:ETO28475.1 hypothetical protein RFI_08657 [Reticulomyxa filosa]
MLNGLRPHSLWSLDIFLVNDKMKRLLYFSLHAVSKLFKHDHANDEPMSEDFEAMDLDMGDGKYQHDEDATMGWLSQNEMSPPPPQIADHHNDLFWRPIDVTTKSKLDISVDWISSRNNPPPLEHSDIAE